MTTFPNHEHRDDERLTRFLTGELGQAEEVEFRAWVAADPHRESLLNTMRDGWRKAGWVHNPVESEQFLVRLRARLAQHDEERSSTSGLEFSGNKVSKDIQRIKRWNVRLIRNVALGLAAVSTIVFSTHWMFDRGVQKPEGDKTATVHSTAKGQRATVTLPDGSTVILNVASRLEVPQDFGTNARAVRLTGQAMFVVNHRQGVPFTVTTERQTTRVLGTTFVVREYATDTVSTVIVREGKVVVSSTVLTPLQQGNIDNIGRVHVTMADMTQFGFATGTLSLTGIRFRDALQELNRWYDADIRIGDSTLGQRRISLESTNESLTDFVSMLEWSYGVRVVRDGRILTLYSR